MKLYKKKIPKVMGIVILIVIALLFLRYKKIKSQNILNEPRQDRLMQELRAKQFSNLDNLEQVIQTGFTDNIAQNEYDTVDVPIEIRVKNDIVYLNNFQIDRPEEFNIVDKNPQSVTFSAMNEDGREYLRLTLGKKSQEETSCYEYYYDTLEEFGSNDIDDILDMHYSRFHSLNLWDVRDHIVMNHCFPAEVIGGLQIPEISYRRAASLRAPIGQYDNVINFRKSTYLNVLNQEWIKNNYKINPQKVSELSNTLAEYLRNGGLNNLLVLDGVRLVFPGGSGEVGVVGVTSHWNWKSTDVVFDRLNNFKDFLHSCDERYVENYINNVQELKPSLEKMKIDLSCAGEITFERGGNAGEYW